MCFSYSAVFWLNTPIEEDIIKPMNPKIIREIHKENKIANNLGRESFLMDQSTIGAKIYDPMMANTNGMSTTLSCFRTTPTEIAVIVNKHAVWI